MIMKGVERYYSMRSPMDGTPHSLKINRDHLIEDNLGLLGSPVHQTPHAVPLKSFNDHQSNTQFHPYTYALVFHSDLLFKCDLYALNYCRCVHFLADY